MKLPAYRGVFSSLAVGEFIFKRIGGDLDALDGLRLLCGRKHGQTLLVGFVQRILIPNQTHSGIVSVNIPLAYKRETAGALPG
jgi:hypothetical protein